MTFSIASGNFGLLGNAESSSTVTGESFEDFLISELVSNWKTKTSSFLHNLELRYDELYDAKVLLELVLSKLVALPGDNEVAILNAEAALIKTVTLMAEIDEEYLLPAFDFFMLGEGVSQIQRKVKPFQ